MSTIYLISRHANKGLKPAKYHRHDVYNPLIYCNGELYTERPDSTDEEIAEREGVRLNRISTALCEQLRELLRRGMNNTALAELTAAILTGEVQPG